MNIRYAFVENATVSNVQRKRIIMSKRVTIVIDNEIDKKLRIRQAKIIQQSHSSCSYSRVLNETIRKVLK